MNLRPIVSGPPVREAIAAEIEALDPDWYSNLREAANRPLRSPENLSGRADGDGAALASGSAAIVTKKQITKKNRR